MTDTYQNKTKQNKTGGSKKVAVRLKKKHKAGCLLWAGAGPGGPEQAA
jgi:hypothetical protein